ncbi:hypothetical protein SmJEL517_g02021 [Synchytrium microbalum]|uniref:Phosphoketolase n=1 Tax=Synchytrium microbalum TaxID=1806994 RepID=A0A507C972_9FUNG|nr:uncharacterized protein SmJEL517_g02021 [Synchytrium microbalum]TPX35719.1 hypothetical protein SmJEL517_g02021 [Synchytrium microbalum]
MAEQASKISALEQNVEITDLKAAKAPPGSFVVPEAFPNVESLHVVLDIAATRKSEGKELDALKLYRRAADYITAAMLYLRKNTLLRQDLKVDDIKPRLLGHWGTCPGLTLVYSHCNYLIKKHSCSVLLVVGPGHGAPAILANLFLENTLGFFDPKYAWNNNGSQALISGFSWPGGFPSHVNAQVPGTIHEGGELGYCLSVSFGAIMDNPDLIVTCVVGDGEAESGPLSGSWNGYKFIDPKESGAVLPILHVNGFKIAEGTIYGNMSNAELATLFTGFGYQVRIVEHMADIDADLATSMEWAYLEIRRIQHAARTGSPIMKPRWPMIVLRTPKGWNGPKATHGLPVEGSWRAHQIPLTNPFTDDEQFKGLNQWLKSYGPEELFDDNGVPIAAVLDAVPSEMLRMGRNPHTYAVHEELDTPDPSKFAVKESKNETEWVGAMGIAGKYLAELTQKNPKSFRLFSPDEMESNKLGDMLKVTTRNFQPDPVTANSGGRVIEILSEHNCQGWMQGYTLTGRTALFPSYEAFLGIITTMMVQYSKFAKMSRDTPWRRNLSSLNYVESSTLWRQEHNGFSHQNPGFIDTVVNLKSNQSRVYLPPDANTLLATIDHCMRSKGHVNLIVSGKSPVPVYFNTYAEAKHHCNAGAGILKFASTDGGVNPDVVLVGCGCETTMEVVAAAALLKKDAPALRVRVVNVTDLMILADPGASGHPHGLTTELFNSLFTADKPIVFNFHGYPSVVKSLLFDRVAGCDRLVVLGYIEEGTTTTPFDMLVLNQADRFTVAIRALTMASKVVAVAPDVVPLNAKYLAKIHEHQKYILATGQDMPEFSVQPVF